MNMHDINTNQQARERVDELAGIVGRLSARLARIHSAYYGCAHESLRKAVSGCNIDLAAANRALDCCNDPFADAADVWREKARQMERVLADLGRDYNGELLRRSEPEPEPLPVCGQGRAS